MTAEYCAQDSSPRTSFGALLRAFRVQQVRAARRVSRWGSAEIIQTTLSQAGLAKLAGIDPSYVNMLESGLTRWPSRDIALRLAAALELDELDAARLLVAAGFWPWPETDDADTEIAIRVLLAVVRGDYRPLDSSVARGKLEGSGC